MSDSSDVIADDPVPWADDIRIMGLVAIAHGVSHFFHLILAPLFPWLRDAYGYSYAELGFVMTMFFVVSGSFQTVAGFIVDRYGALKTLVGGLVCLSTSAVILGSGAGYGSLLLGATIAGLGNAVFHPVDYWFINHRISLARLAPAYSVHGLSGSLGWALAPIFLVGIATVAGWRVAVLSAGLLPIIVIALLLFSREGLSAHRHIERKTSVANDLSGESKFTFLRDPSVWWCFVFFIILAVAFGGVQTFSPTIFMSSYGLVVTTAALSITVFMIASAVGMIAGAWILMRRQRLTQNIMLGLMVSAAAAWLIGLELVPGTYALSIMAIMGFGSGLSGPSRDMLIRKVTPPGATGRVYGVVYSGLDFGLALGPLLFGKMLDMGLDNEVFFGVGLCLLGAMFTAWRASINRTNGPCIP